MLDHGQRATERIYADVQRRLKRNYRQAAHEVQAKLDEFNAKFKDADRQNRRLLSEGKITKQDYDAWLRGQVFRGEQWRKKRDQITESLYQADTISQRIVNGERIGVFASNRNYMAYAMETGEGVNFGFGVYDNATVANLLKNQPNLLPPRTVKRKADVEWYHKIVNNCVTQGIIQGEGIPAIAKRIAQTTGERGYNAAVRNARTAMTSAQNAGRIEMLHEAQDMGIKVKKRWLATLDDRTRDAHADLDGQVQEVDDYFESSLGPILFPGDPSAEPANVYNCRCTLIYEHPEYPSNFERRDNIDGEIIEDMTYREWEQWKKAEAKENTPEKPTIKYLMLSQSDIKTVFGERPDRALRRTNREEYDRQREAYRQSPFGSWSDGLDAEEQMSIADYSSDTYLAINGYCRGEMTEKMVRKWDISSKLPVEQEIEYIEKAIGKFELQDNIKVYRTCERDVLQAIGNVGDSFKDNGFVSTTIFDKSVASGTVDIVIDVPKGNGRGAWIQPLSGSPDEYEFLLQRGSVFEVSKITETNGRTKIEMTWVGADADEPRYATREQVIERWKRLGLYDEIAAKEI